LQAISQNYIIFQKGLAGPEQLVDRNLMEAQEILTFYFSLPELGLTLRGSSKKWEKYSNQVKNLSQAKCPDLTLKRTQKYQRLYSK